MEIPFPATSKAEGSTPVTSYVTLDQQKPPYHLEITQQRTGRVYNLKAAVRTSCHLIKKPCYLLSRLFGSSLAPVPRIHYNSWTQACCHHEDLLYQVLVTHLLCDKHFSKHFSLKFPHVEVERPRNTDLFQGHSK